MPEYMVRHSSISLSVTTFSTQNTLELYFDRWKPGKVIFWLIIGGIFIVTVACHFNNPKVQKLLKVAGAKPAVSRAVIWVGPKKCRGGNANSARSRIIAQNTIPHRSATKWLWDWEFNALPEDGVFRAVVFYRDKFNHKNNIQVSFNCKIKCH